MGADVQSEVVGEAVLLDFPLRLWARSREHNDELLREFSLMLEGRRSGQASLEVPQALIDLADMFTRSFGRLIDDLTAVREQALSEGLDRIDSVVPLPADTPRLMAQVSRVLEAVDAFCRAGNLLALERPAQSVRLADWTVEELIRQYEGGDPTPWPGPF